MDKEFGFDKLYYALGELSAMASRDKKLDPEFLKAYLHVSNMVMSWCLRADPTIKAGWNEPVPAQERAIRKKTNLRLLTREDN